MIRVLFICHGNICRSPMAEFILKDMVAKIGIEDKFHIESRATSSEEIYRGVGNPVYPPAKKELSAHGISCEGKRAKQLEKSDYDSFDYLIGMEEVNIRNMKRILGNDELGKMHKLLEYAGSDRDIADPWYSGNFEKTFSDIVEGCNGFLQKLKLK